MYNSIHIHYICQLLVNFNICTCKHSHEHNRGDGTCLYMPHLLQVRAYQFPPIFYIKKRRKKSKLITILALRYVRITTIPVIYMIRNVYRHNSTTTCTFPISTRADSRIHIELLSGVYIMW